MKKILILLFILKVFPSFSQEVKYIQESKIDTSQTWKEVYDINDTLSYYYVRPVPFSYIKHSLQDLYLTPKILFKKESVVPIIGVAASTALLIAFDEEITEAAQRFGRYINLAPTNNAKNISPINGIDFYVPTDVSSGLYYIGDGITELAVNSSFYVYSLFTKDPRARQTASQLSEGMIATGIYVQVLKHLTGRSTAWKNNNKDLWRWFPSIKEYHSSVPSYDAFPSGHLSIAMMTTTVIALNYPEKRYIRPLCYSLMALCGYQMLNNGVHWAGDYPLAIALGYTVGKIAVARGRMQVEKDVNREIKENAGIIIPEYNIKPVLLSYGIPALRFTAKF